MTAPLLETRGVWQRFGGLVANSDVSISVGRGEIVGLIGPNGAGKSTLFNLIAGVLQPTQGSIWFDGEDVTALPAAERCVRGDSWLKFQFTRSKLPYFYFALALACIAWFVTWWLEDSKWGFWWRAVKDNPDAAESLGVVVFNSKMGAAAVSAFLVAVGGSFYAQFVSYIDPESVMGFQFSLLMALPAVLGGIGTLWGPMLGAVILIPLTELTRSFIGGSGRGVDLIVYGGLIIAISLARPQGLVGLFSPRRKEVAR